MKKSIRNSVAALFISCALAVGIPVKTQAMGMCCGETALLAVILGTMQTNFIMLYLYMITGIGDVGTGIVGTTSANAQSQMSHDETGKSNLQAHYKAVERQKIGEFIVAENNNKTFGDPRQCSEAVIKQDIGAKAAVTAAASSSANSAAKTSTALAISRNTPSQSSYAGQVIKDLATYCSASDAANGRCSKSPLPDGNVRAQGMFAPAFDFTNPSAAATSTTLTFDAPGAPAGQLKAATDTAANLLGSFSPPNLPKAVADTPAGRMYNAKFKIYEARLSPAEMILTGIIGRRASSPEAAETWSDISSEYSDIFSGATAPLAPSELEALRYEVARRYAGSEWMAKIKASANFADALRERAINESVELKLLFEIHTRMEEQSAARAAILTQLVSPVSKKEVEAAGVSSFRSKQ